MLFEDAVHVTTGDLGAFNRPVQVCVHTWKSADWNCVVLHLLSGSDGPEQFFLVWAELTRGVHSPPRVEEQGD